MPRFNIFAIGQGTTKLEREGFTAVLQGCK